MTSPSPRDPLDLVRADPDDEGAYLICSDALQERGDPRGELIALQFRRKDDPDDPRIRSAEAQLIQTHRRAFLGPVADHLATFAFHWHRGFINELRVLCPARGRSDGLESILPAMLEHPSCAVLRSLVLGPIAKGPQKNRHRVVQAVIEAIANAAIPQSLDSLFVFNGPADRPPQTRQPCEIENLIAAVPRLRHLTLYGGSTPLRLGHHRLPHLRSLWLHGTTDALVANLEQSDLRGLTELAIWCSSEDDIERIERLLAMQLPQLRSLRVRHIGRAADRLCAALVRTILFGHLDTLELCLARLTSTGVDHLLASNIGRIELLGVEIDSESAAMLSDHKTVVSRWTNAPPDLPYVRFGTHNSYLGRMGADVTDPTLANDVEHVLRRSPDAGRSLYDGGTLKLQAKDKSVAIEMLRCALRVADPTYYQSTFANLGVALERSGKLDEAEEVARRGLLAFPNDPNHWAIVIDALRRTGRLQQAVTEVDASSHLVNATNNGLALLNDCIITLVAANRTEDAVELYERFAEDHTPPEKTQAFAALMYAHSGNHEAMTTLLSSLKSCKEPIIHHARACRAALSSAKHVVHRQVELARAAGYTEMWFLEKDPLLAPFLD